jgi:DNA (cytosine-5)-methyltransferase 1
MKKENKSLLSDYRFIDLFCGIGGFHSALSSFGAKCVFASDINMEARKIYKQNFKIEPFGDIKSVKEDKIPVHDILCAGFPCQAFSISGTQQGFTDEKSGSLFFEIIRIAKYHKPRILFLENVANLEAHDNGKSLERIKNELKDIGYITFAKVLNALDYNVPQCRKRIYIVAFHEELGIHEFAFPNAVKAKKHLKDVLQPSEKVSKDYVIEREYSLREGYNDLVATPQNPYIRIGEIGLGRQGERIYSIDGCATTLSASGGGLGGRTGMYLIDGKIRKLTPRECARLMGFRDSFVHAGSAHQSYQQFGNSVVVDVLQHIIINIMQALNKEEA